LTVSRVRAQIAGVSGLPGLYTAYFSGSAGVTSIAEANDVCARVRVLWNQVKGDLAAGVTVLVSPVVDTLDTATGALLGRTAASSVPAVVTSTGTGELPPFTMGGLKLLTAGVVNGRLLQGRSFIGPLATASSNSGVPSAGFSSDMTTGATGLVSGATALINVVWHRPSATHVGGAVSLVTSYAADSKLWVLRSRRDWEKEDKVGEYDDSNGYSAAGTYKLWVTLSTAGTVGCHVTRRVWHGPEKLDWKMDSRHFVIHPTDRAAHDVYALLRLVAQQFGEDW
jgi:hypothetical protein